MTFQLIQALCLSFVVALLVGYYYVPWLRKIKAGQQILEIGPNWHKTKAGTPTMGGVIFIVSVAAAVLIAGFSCIRSGDLAGVYVLVFSLFYGAIGFLDDYQKLKKKQNLGLSAKAKFLLQLLAAAALLALLRMEGYLSNEVYIPIWNTSFTLPFWLYYIFAAFVIVGTVNAVNLTDGIDGLCTGVTIPVFLFYTLICFYWGSAYASLSVFSAGLTGGLIAFLFFNFNPAKCFMGDTGSLFLGGAVCGMAFALDMPLILILLGIIYILETLSDIIQVSYFKLTHGKRVFKMAPFHHHLEMGGWLGHKWTEKQIFALFSSISLLFAIFSFLACRSRVI